MNGDSLPSPSPNSESQYLMRPTIHKMDKACQFTPECVEETANAAAAATQTVQELNHNITSPTRNVSVRRSIEEEEAIESAEEPAQTVNPQAKVALEVQEKIESDPDMVDAKWPPLEPNRQDEDGCGVQCLFYTVQCCDCTIL